MSVNPPGGWSELGNSTGWRKKPASGQVMEKVFTVAGLIIYTVIVAAASFVAGVVAGITFCDVVLQ